jgi:hypothetical protein
MMKKAKENIRSGTKDEITISRGENSVGVIALSKSY